LLVACPKHLTNQLCPTPLACAQRQHRAKCTGAHRQEQQELQELLLRTIVEENVRSVHNAIRQATAASNCRGEGTLAAPWRPHKESTPTSPPERSFSPSSSFSFWAQSIASSSTERIHHATRFLFEEHLFHQPAMLSPQLAQCLPFPAQHFFLTEEKEANKKSHVHPLILGRFREQGKFWLGKKFKDRFFIG